MSIFISIAAYEDPSLLDTMRSALENADKPQDIVFGIALQYKIQPDLSEFNHDQLRVISYDPATRPGIVRIRYNISKLFNDEDFYVQIDSHYRFAKSWDSKLIAHYNHLCAQTGTDKVYLLPLGPYGDEIMTSSWSMQVGEYLGAPTLNLIPDNGRAKFDSLYNEISYARVGQCFFPGKFIKEVGFDPYTQVGHEIAYFSYRLFISGYRMFQVNEELLTQEDAEYLKLNWEDVPDGTPRFGSIYAQDNHMTQYEMALAFILNDHTKYAVRPEVRTPEEFWIAQGRHEDYLQLKKKIISFIRNDF